MTVVRFYRTLSWLSRRLGSDGVDHWCLTRTARYIDRVKRAAGIDPALDRGALLIGERAGP